MEADPGLALLLSELLEGLGVAGQVALLTNGFPYVRLFANEEVELALLHIYLSLTAQIVPHLAYEFILAIVL